MDRVLRPAQLPELGGGTARDMPDLRIVQPQALLRDQVLTRLRNAIIEGWYPPGTRLIERELCDALGVSRTSVREVLRQLESEHLVKVEPRRGPVVATITSSDAREIYETRAIIESALARNFIERAPASAFEELGRSVDSFTAAAFANDHPALLVSMMRFYDTLAEGAQNTVLHGLMRQLVARIAFLRNKSLSEPGRVSVSVAEMREFADAIVARDPDRAARAAVHHVRSAQEAALRQLSAETRDRPLAATGK
jgi:GntR family transcriptional regulator, trigonelline degradation regulator